MDEATAETQTSEHWRALLTGEDASLRKLRQVWRHVPSSPRCKVCAAPFSGLGKIATKLAMHGRSIENPLLCGMCFRELRKHPGGAEVEISVLFADIRGSTAMAERLSPADFRGRVQHFYELGAKAIERNGGIVDKFLGDGIMALFIPVLAGERHARRAITAGRDLMVDLARSDLPRDGVHVGAGVDAGTAFVGVLGSDDRLDFTALGDTVNTAARLGSAAGPDRLIVSDRAWTSAGLEPAGGLARHDLDVAGKAAPLPVVDLGAEDLALIG